MYAATTFPAPRAPIAFANAYRQVGVQTGVESASPHRLVAMLYDGLLECLVQASGALQAGNVELKIAKLGRAHRIVDEGLKSVLDLNAGGTLAADLHALYAYVTTRLTHANLHNDTAAIDECRRLIEPLRDAWSEIADRPEARG